MILPLTGFITGSTITWKTGLIGRYRFKLIYSCVGIGLDSLNALVRLSSNCLFDGLQDNYLYLPTNIRNSHRLGDIPDLIVDVKGDISITCERIHGVGIVNPTLYIPSPFILLFKVEKI
jgi:hypothetical protein